MTVANPSLNANANDKLSDVWQPHLDAHSSFLSQDSPQNAAVFKEDLHMDHHWIDPAMDTDTCTSASTPLLSRANGDTQEGTSHRSQRPLSDPGSDSIHAVQMAFKSDQNDHRHQLLQPRTQGTAVTSIDDSDEREERKAANRRARNVAYARKYREKKRQARESHLLEEGSNPKLAQVSPVRGRCCWSGRVEFMGIPESGVLLLT